MGMSASREVETLRADCPPINSFASRRSCIFFVNKLDMNIRLPYDYK